MRQEGRRQERRKREGRRRERRRRERRRQGRRREERRREERRRQESKITRRQEGKVKKIMGEKEMDNMLPSDSTAGQNMTNRNRCRSYSEVLTEWMRRKPSFVCEELDS